MSTEGDDRQETLLDRLNNIVEEGEECEDESNVDDYSFDPIFVGEVEDEDEEEDESLGEDDGEDDYDEDAATPLEYHWAPQNPDEASDSASFVSDFQSSGLSFDDLTYPQESLVYDAPSIGTSSDDSGRHKSVKRSSFTAPRRYSNSRYSFSSIHSAPQPGDTALPVPPAERRRVTICVPMDEDGDIDHVPRMSRQPSRRRQSVSVKAIAKNASLGSSGLDEEESSTSNSSSRMSAAGRYFARKSTRRTSVNTMSGSAAKGLQGHVDSIDLANSIFGQSGNSEWENVAAAAAVAAAGASGGGKNSHTQFAVGEHILVLLNTLNHTNSVDNPDVFTVNPVNKWGYPRGEGTTAEEQQGPYVYVLAIVKKVHFDEDVRYYTVARADSGTEQRADTVWMERIKSPIAVEAATRAAQQTTQSESEKVPIEKEDKVNVITAVLGWPVFFAQNTIKPVGRAAIAKTKEHIEMILYGSSPYWCKIQATGINFLVFCSATFVFLDSIALAFFPASSDFAVAAIGVTVWAFLVMELFLEWMIRPPDYYHLVESEKAYAPSTARSINSFHMFFELLSLALYIPEFICLGSNNCGDLTPFSALWASITSVLGPTLWDSCLGHFCIGLRTLRMFALVRHWKKMRINNTLSDGTNIRDHYDSDRIDQHKMKRQGKNEEENHSEDFHAQVKSLDKASSAEDQRLKNAATIGTSLMVVNSHRALFIITLILVILPMILSMLGVNPIATEMTDLLQENNIMAINCEYLEVAVDSWLRSVAYTLSPAPLDTNKHYLLWAQISPSPRGCTFLNGTGGVITNCDSTNIEDINGVCAFWNSIAPTDPNDASPAYFAEKLGLREGGIAEYIREFIGPLTGNFNDFVDDPLTGNTTFTVRTVFNQNQSVAYTNFSNFLLLLTSLILCLVGLAVLYGDAGRLVLHPLRRMLKIVVRYAENPLSQTAARTTRYKRKQSRYVENVDDDSDGDRDKDWGQEQLGNYETEQLINAISKIADLLRKCWGVAGAGIISSNLARTQDGKTVVFNPTVPGKQVYALFGFVTINGFSDQLRALDRDVMILINDVASVVHDEVFRWALGDSGQCNKNLGSSFLMVFRIGDFKEVREKQARATDVVFSSHEKRAKKTNTLRRRRQVQGVNHGKGSALRTRVVKGDRATGSDTLQLASLPGIQTFSDRALLGMLKSFAGLLRDKELAKWKRDFRLGGGVGAYVVSIIIGMDAGWAVEGAVGSEYKIDATYLSPHVNMAARMMSATKQYGVTILLSQAVEELLSPVARSKLRHLDTVYVKGSSVSQRIFTYDARHQGVDFFLFERSPEQSDMDAENYTPAIWENDQDLRAMRQHVTEEFFLKFKEGKDLYLAGDWKEAIEVLKEADVMMITNVLEEGYIDYNPDEIDGRIFDRRNNTEDMMRLRAELGDGPCRCLISFMEKRNATPPDDWRGVRPLTSK